MATEVSASGRTRGDGAVVGTLDVCTEGSPAFVVTADGNKSLLALLQAMCAEVVALQPPGAPIPKEWTQMLTVPAAGTTVIITSSFRTETVTPA